MKTLFIEAKSNINIIPVIKKVKLKSKIGLATTIQHLHKLNQAKKIISNSIIAGQVIGCDVSSAIKIKNKVDYFLYIGSGRFHPLEIAVKTNKVVYIANPFNNKISKISKKEINTYNKRKKGRLLKFYNAKKIGILISTKPGQFHPKHYFSLNKKLKLAKSIQKKIKKESYIFIFNTLNFNELENYPDIDCFVNLACPRIDDDYEKFKKPMINYLDIK